MKDWGVFVLIYVCYASLEFIAPSFTYVYIKEVYDLELLLFGWLFEGQIPAFWWKDHLNPILSILTSIVYSFHVFVPVIVGIVIKFRSENDLVFKQMIYSFFVLCIMAFLTFTIYPVAAPWYVDAYGFAQPETKVRILESAGGLLVIDDMFDIELFGPYYESFNADPFAAFPSMHSGLSFFSVFYLIKCYRTENKYVWFSLLYPAAVWFSAVYLQHHYIIDLVGGAAYVLISAYIIEVIYNWHLKRVHTLNPVPIEGD